MLSGPFKVHLNKVLHNCFLLFKDSEEKKSTTLDVKLKETERELKQHEKEIADQMEVKQQVILYLQHVQCLSIHSYMKLTRKNLTQPSPY